MTPERTDSEEETEPEEQETSELDNWDSALPDINKEPLP